MPPLDLHIRRVTDPGDPAIAAFGHLQDRIYFEPDMLIPARYISQMLAANQGERQDVLLLAEDERSGVLLGGTVFHFLPSAGTGFSSFLGVDTSVRGRGVARALHDERWRTLQQVSGGTCQALFIDVVNPERESAEQRQHERQAGSDAEQRRRSFHALGFRTVDLPYEQPVGGPDGGPVTDMDLLAYLPGPPDSIPAALASDTMLAYWTPWLGRKGAEAAAEKLRAGQQKVRLLPAWEGPLARQSS
jgi:hypothetical protein